MKYTHLSENLDVATVTRLIEDSRDAELRRDIDASEKIFKPVWPDLEADPDFSDFETIHQAELYRLTGFFLSSYGKAKNLKFYQERGKNLITKAVNIYSELNDNGAKSEAQVMLAACYFYEGALNESELILEQTELEFEGSRLDPVYLQICINQMATMLRKREYQKTFKVINEISVPMEFCQDNRLCILFHEKCGHAYKNTGQFGQAINHFHEAIRFAQVSGNYLYLASNKNNLANLYLRTRESRLAHLNVDEAITIAQENEFVGWLPHFFDTKAVIYFNEGNFEQALEAIDQSISIFEKGEDADGLTEAIWNKCKFLLYLGRKEEALLLFNDLIPRAAQLMGEFALKRFVKEFADLIHVKQNGSLDREVRRFKKAEIVNAIVESKYNLYAAAELLKINLTNLTKTLNKEFPELYAELNLIPKTTTEQNFEIVNSKPSAPRNISQLNLDSSKFRFQNEVPPNLKTFYFSADQMLLAFGIKNDAVVAVVPIETLRANEFILVEDLSRRFYLFGKINYDSSLDLYYLVENEEPVPISTNEFNLIGKAVSFCSLEEVDRAEILFRNLD